MANVTKLCLIVFVAGTSGFQLSIPEDQHLAVGADGTVDAPILTQTESNNGHQAGIIGPKVQEFMRTLSSFESLVQKRQRHVGLGMMEELASSREVLTQVMSQVQGQDDGSAATVIGTNSERILNAMAHLKKVAHEFRARRAKLEHAEEEEEEEKDGEEAEEDEEQDSYQSKEDEQIDALPQLGSNVSDPDKIMVDGHVVPLVEALANFKDSMYDMKRMLIYRKYMASKHNLTADSKNMSQLSPVDDDRVEDFLQSLLSARDAVHQMRIKMNGKSEPIALAQVVAPHSNDIIEDFLHEHGLSEGLEKILGDENDATEDDVSNSLLQIGGPANEMQGNSTQELMPKFVHNLCVNNTLAPALLVLGGESASSGTFISELQQQPGVAAIKELNISSLMEKQRKEGQLDPRVIYRNWLGAYPECQQDGPALSVDKTPYWSVAKAPEFLHKFYGKNRKDVKLVLFIEPPIKKLQKLFYLKQSAQQHPQLQNITFGQYANMVSMDKKHQSKLANQARTLFKLFQWFKAFHHSQFIIVPPRMELSLKNRGKLLREIQKLYDLPTMTQPYPHAKQYEHENLPHLMQENLTDSDLWNLREHLGTEFNIARLLAVTNATLLGFKGDRQDAAEIAHWMGKNW